MTNLAKVISRAPECLTNLTALVSMGGSYKSHGNCSPVAEYNYWCDPDAVNGEIDQNALRTLRLTAADLMEALRGKDVFDPRDVSYAVVETNGSLSVALRPEKEPATLADLGARVQRAQATIPFVLDGQVLAENLTTCGKDAAWLERTAQANSLLLEEILILAGNDTEDPSAWQS